MRVMTNHQQSIDAGVLLYQNTLGYTICSITCTVFRTIIRHAQKGKRNSKSTSIVADKTLHMHESSGRFIFPLYKNEDISHIHLYGKSI